MPQVPLWDQPKIRAPPLLIKALLPANRAKYGHSPLINTDVVLIKDI